jgi:hypothetical protein
VDHPLVAHDSLIRPWRTAAFVAAAIAALELLILLVIGGGTLVGAVSDRVEQAATKRAVSTPSASKRAATKPAAPATAALPRTKVRVLVLNGNGRQGAAATAAARVQGRGYRIAGVANAPRSDFSRSIVMYKPGFIGEGKRLGRDLGVPLVTPLDGMRPRQLGRAHAVFILGP